MPRLAWLILVFWASLGLGLSGCVTPSLPLAPQPKTKLYLEPIITPQKADLAAARVGIFPFGSPFVDPALNNHLAHQLHQLLLTRRFARVIEVIPETFRNVHQAIERGRFLGYDVVIIGHLQESFWGGDVEPSKATVELRVVDSVREMTIWYLKASATSEPRPAQDYLLFRTYGHKAKVPADLIRHLLIELSDVLAGRLPAEEPEEILLAPEPESPY